MSIVWTDARGAELDRLCAEMKDDEEDLKECVHCHKLRHPMTEFYACAGTKDGRDSWCRMCRKEQYKAYQKKNQAKRTAYMKQWYAKNRERWRAYHRAYVARKKAEKAA